MTAPSDPKPEPQGAIEQLTALIAIAEEHRVRYNSNGTEYWNGRRDEAGWFRDKIQALADSLRSDLAAALKRAEELQAENERLLVSVKRNAMGILAIVNGAKERLETGLEPEPDHKQPTG